MLEFIRAELAKMHIDLVSSLSLDECIVTRPYLLERNGIKSGSVIIFAVPYLTKISEGARNVSSYAVSRDYHLFFKELFSNLTLKLKEKYPDNKFAGFTDHSPINEIHAAALCDLGVVGKNRLLITKKYSSYVFLGEIVTDASLPSLAKEIKSCINCGRCISACPVNMDSAACLSALTQKKGELSEDEKQIIKTHACAWGCDKCQECCPYTANARSSETLYSSVDFFNEDLTPTLSRKAIGNMTDDEFSKRAYSWRGKKTIMRNLEILEESEN